MTDHDMSISEELLGMLSEESRQVLSLAMADTPSQSPRCYLVVIEDECEPTIKEFSDMILLAGYLRDNYPADALLASEVRIFIFYGLRVFTTQKPFPHLVHPAGPLIPLYTVTRELVRNDDGLLNPADPAIVEEVASQEVVSDLDDWDLAEGSDDLFDTHVGEPVASAEEYSDTVSNEEPI